MSTTRPERARGVRRVLVRAHRSDRVARGQALVELALVVPILLLLVLGALDLGRVFYSQITVNDAAREGALEAAKNPTSFISGTACTSGNMDSNRIMCRATNEARGGFVTVSPSDVSVQCSSGACPATPALGQTVTVSVTGTFTPITPVIGSIIGNSVTLTGSASAQLNAAPAATTGAPSAAFSANPSSGTAPLPVTFTDQSVGSPATWAWDFGDGQSAAGQGPHVHTYTSDGSYTVRLTVSNAGGTTYTTRVITVATPTPPPPGPPVAAFSATPASGAAPLDVTFTDLSTGSPTAWAWTFGDGTTSTDQHPGMHTYANPGSYTVTLEVTNADGSDTETTTITTSVACLSPTASFTVSPGTGTKNSTQFDVTDSSTNMGTAGCNNIWSWDFGDGAGSTLADPPNHIYTKKGTYTIQLTVSNLAGSDTTTRTVTVNN